MPYMPLMPTSADEVASPMPGANTPAPVPGGVPGDSPLAALMGGAMGGAPAGTPNMGGELGMPPPDPLQGALSQFDQLAQTIADLARMFPGSEQSASEMMEALDRWRQQILIMMTPQASAMPGADMMM